MKRLLSLMIVLALFAGLVSSCDWFLESNGETEIPEGVMFYTSSNLMFYFETVEGNEGHELIDINNPETYPIAFYNYLDSISRWEAASKVDIVSQEGMDYYVYNGGHNWVFEQDGRVCFGTHVWGRTKDAEYTCYLYVGGGRDSLTVSYKYLTAKDDVQISGGSWAVLPESVKYNEKEVLQNNKDGKVFVSKPSRDVSYVSINVAD